MKFKTALLLIGLGAGATLAMQSYLQPAKVAQSALRGPPRAAQRAPRPLAYPTAEPVAQDIAARFRSVAEDARAHIVCRGQQTGNFYYGGSSSTSLDCEASAPIPENDYVGNLATGGNHE